MLFRTSLSFLTIKQGIFEMFLTLELFCHPVTLIGFDKFTSENVRCNLITKTKFTSSSRWPNYVRFCPEVRCLFWLKSIQASFPCKSCHLWKRSLGAVHLVSTGRAGIRVWSVRVYTITWLLCAFSLVVDSDLLKDTHTDDVKSTSDHVSRLVFLFSCPKNPSMNHLNFYWIWIFIVTPIVSYFFVLCTLWRHLWSITVHTHGKCNLFVK